MANKDGLTRYACAYPDFMELVRFHKAQEEARSLASQPGQEGVTLVGFGQYKLDTLRDLYEGRAGGQTGRVAAVLADYIHIREIVLDNPRLMAQTALQLFELNQRTLSQWFSRRQKEWERTVLEQAVVAPSTPAVASQPSLPSTDGSLTRPSCHPPASQPSSTPPRPLQRHRPFRGQQRGGGAKRRREQGRRRHSVKRRNPVEYICARCKQPKRREFGHSPFGKVSFCATAAGKSVEEWLAEMKDSRE
ncbi:hypothetical protein ANANG_G00283780 [Anguilla anguilla]|uniref:Uncharacterized protein n=1 Tax=Anguilla anguilla TaxID=7936 RepID=A0A9D3LK65_ANGAN|nr:hypothetical protein ANANG_G00283780 [Anguilla anguilla]